MTGIEQRVDTSCSRAKRHRKIGSNSWAVQCLLGTEGKTHCLLNMQQELRSYIRPLRKLFSAGHLAGRLACEEASQIPKSPISPQILFMVKVCLAAHFHAGP